MRLQARATARRCGRVSGNVPRAPRSRSPEQKVPAVRCLPCERGDEFVARARGVAVPMGGGAWPGLAKTRPGSKGVPPSPPGRTGQSNDGLPAIARAKIGGLVNEAVALGRVVPTEDRAARLARPREWVQVLFSPRLVVLRSENEDVFHLSLLLSVPPEAWLPSVQVECLAGQGATACQVSGGTSSSRALGYS
jgi:hypothetical protein